MGSVSAAMTTNSDTPRFSVFVAASTHDIVSRARAWHVVQGLSAGSKAAACIMHSQGLAPSLAPFFSCL